MMKMSSTCAVIGRVPSTGGPTPAGEESTGATVDSWARCKGAMLPRYGHGCMQARHRLPVSDSPAADLSGIFLFGGVGRTHSIGQYNRPRSLQTSLKVFALAHPPSNMWFIGGGDSRSPQRLASPFEADDRLSRQSGQHT